MFDPKTPTEEDSFEFDYTDKLASGETVVSAVITIDVISGVDPSPGSMIGGSPTINSPKVTVKLIGGVDGVLYCVHCLATTSTGLKKPLQSDLRVASGC